MFWFAGPVFLFTKANRRGLVTCMNCGASLLVTGQKQSIWVYFYSTVAVLAAFAFSYNHLFILIGSGATALYWAILIFLVAYVFNHGMWKHAILTKVAENSPSN